MRLAPGTRIGPYEVAAQIGVGGMGEVYRATDTNLKRQVAIKVLPASVAGDAGRLARFQREAEALAAVNHPNIAQIHGLERSAGTIAIVMELVEGEDLLQLLARRAGPSGPAGLPLDEALAIAKQIAEALEAAHGQGIIHRDLKPANIKVRSDGTVKVLDFGLAKAVEGDRGQGIGDRGNVSQAATITTPAMMTGIGTILGTAAYMSPEQARGKVVDKRADIWAFGAVLFEMLTGTRAFGGDEISDTLAEVLKTEPRWDLLSPDTPPAIRRLLRRCLEKDPRERLPDIGAARLDIKDARAEPESARPTVPAPVVSRTRERFAWGVVAALTLIAVGALAWALRPLPVPLETRLEITTPPTEDPFSFAMSPDGRRLVFVASAEGGRSQLWLRPVDQTAAQPLAGTEGASFPFWSPDSQSLAFFADNVLKRLDVGGGPPRTLANTGEGASGGSWNSDGVIVFAPSGGPLSRVSATGTSGGALLAVTKLAPGQNAHRFPQFLPDGRRFLFYARGGPSAGVHLGSIDSEDITRLAAADTSAQFVPPNWLLYLRQRTLFAQQFDLSRSTLSGEPVPIADQVAFNATNLAGAFSASAAGSITYRTGDRAMTQLTWLDRSGQIVGTVGGPDTNNLLHPSVSPDGRRVVASRTVDNNTDVWIFDSARMVRLTFDTGLDGFPLWSPDGSRIVFGKISTGALSLYAKASTGAGGEELLLTRSPVSAAPADWSPDGRFLLFGQSSPETTGRDIWVLPMDGKQQVYPLLNSRFEERLAVFSPDGRWVAYQTDESGRPEIYLRQFPMANGQWQASTLGGVTPRWRRDGKELYYLAPDGKLMAVPTVLTGSAPEMGTPTALFQPRILNGGTQPLGTGTQYDVAPDGRFLMNITLNNTSAAPLTVIQNWNPEATK